MRKPLRAAETLWYRTLAEGFREGSPLLATDLLERRPALETLL
jgi:hypothetical protein